MKLRHWFYVAGVMVMCGTSVIGQTSGPAAYQLIIRGGQMSKEEAAQLEQHLEKEPDDLDARMKLLGYYQMQQYGPRGDHAARTKHILWIIQHHPEAQVAGMPYTSINPVFDATGYNEAKAAWLKAVKDHPRDAVVYGNAADFFLLNDRKTAEELLQKAVELEPKEPKWADKLAHLYALNGLGEGKAQPAKALNEFEHAQKLDTEASGRFYRLDSLAKAAVNAGDMAKASKYADELLKLAPQYRGDWNYGNAVHHGNIVLGRVALSKGDVKAACDYLLKAGETTGSPQLDSFGPNMSLAKELLAKGEKTTVLKYFDLCGKFWNDKKLQQWKDDVNAGRVPDFGANLVY